VAKEDLQPNRCARLLGALAEPERLRLIEALRGGPRNVGELAEELKVPLANASHHLTVLRNAGLVEARKQGRFVLYSLAPGVLQTAAGTEHLDLGCCRLELPGGGNPPGETPGSAS
jgi:DNA-binding transcriptional ArsR family regulator